MTEFVSVKGEQDSKKDISSEREVILKRGEINRTLVVSSFLVCLQRKKVELTKQEIESTG